MILAVWTKCREAYSVIHLEDEFKSKFLYRYRGNCMFKTRGKTSLLSWHILYLSICIFLLSSIIDRYILSLHTIILSMHKTVYLCSLWDLPCCHPQKKFSVGNSQTLNYFLKPRSCVTLILPNWIAGAAFLSSYAASTNSSDKFWDNWDKETSGKDQPKENRSHRPQREAF